MSDIGQIRDSLCFVSDEDGAAILDIQRGKMSTLNSTGASIWEALERGDSPDKIIAQLASETGENPLVIEQDVREFLGSLESSHLLPNVPGSL